MSWEGASGAAGRRSNPDLFRQEGGEVCGLVSESWQREWENGRSRAPGQLQKCHCSPPLVHFSLPVTTPCGHRVFGKTQTLVRHPAIPQDAVCSIRGSEGRWKSCQPCHNVAARSQKPAWSSQSSDKTEGHLKLIIPCCKREQLGKAATRPLGFLLYKNLVENPIPKSQPVTVQGDPQEQPREHGHETFHTVKQQPLQLHPKGFFPFQQKNPDNKQNVKGIRKISPFGFSKLCGDII